MNMTKGCLKAGIALVILAAGASPALADMKAKITRTSGYYKDNGGEFTIKPIDDLVGQVQVGMFSDIAGNPGTYQSFCIEVSENVSPGSTYHVDINPYSVMGGAGGQDGIDGYGNTTDSIDPRTAYLYTQFRQGTLSGYNYTPGTGRKNSAGALQLALWLLESEIASTGNAQADLWVAEADDAVNTGAWTGIGGVRAINVFAGTSRTTGYRQDMLTLVPQPIPAPDAVLLGLMGLGLVGGLRRRLG